MHKAPPPLNALRAFEAAARHLSLTKAAQELNVTASAPTVEQARARAYKAVDLIDWPEGFCRRDIAWRAVARRS